MDFLFGGSNGRAVGWVKVNGTSLPTPKEFTPVYSDFDSSDSVRDETGYLRRTVIRTGQVDSKKNGYKTL